MSASTDTLRRHRIAMQRALRDNLPLDEARKRIAIEERLGTAPRPTASRQVPHQWWMDL